MIACLSYDKTLFISNTIEFENAFPSKAPEEPREGEQLMFKNVKYISVGGSDLAYIDEFGHV